MGKRTVWSGDSRLGKEKTAYIGDELSMIEDMMANLLLGVNVHCLEKDLGDGPAHTQQID